MYLQVDLETDLKFIIDQDTLEVYMCLLEEEEDMLLRFDKKIFVRFEGEYYINVDFHDHCKDKYCAQHCKVDNRLMKVLKSQILTIIEN